MASVSFNVFTVYKKEELMAWHPSGVTRTRIIRVIGVNFSEFLIGRNRDNEIRVIGVLRQYVHIAYTKKASPMDS